MIRLKSGKYLKARKCFTNIKEDIKNRKKQQGKSHCVKNYDNIS